MSSPANKGNGTGAGTATADTLASPGFEAAETVLADDAASSQSVTRPRDAPARSVTGSVGGSLVEVTGESALGPTPQETLRFDEIQRTRVFLKISIVMAAAVATSSVVLNGDPIAEMVLWTGMGAIVVAFSWLLYAMRRDEGYTLGRSLIGAYASVFGALSGIYYFGPFSPGPIIIPFGLFFFSLSQSRRATLSVYLLCAAGQAILGVGAITEWIPDRGIIRGDALPLLDRLAIIALCEVVFLGTFLIGRASRNATLRAVEQHDNVLRRVAQREALLKEARQQLDRAMKVGGVGRYTDQILGSFRLGKVIGRGAMGEVYEATHLERGTTAAVKLLQTDLLSNPDSVRRFVREARIAASLKVRHVVRVYEVGGLDRLPYIAMEHLEGTDLSDYLRQQSRLSLDDTVRLANEVASALDAAQNAGIVHRDLKPANVFHARHGDGRVWKVLDFGVSKLIGTIQGTLTRENALVGTPEYMAPEQPLGREITHRTDIYALGVICYRALTGTPAFTGDGMMAIIYNVVNRMPARPSDVLATIPEDVELVLAIAMAKSPDDRFTSATEMSAALAAAARGELDDETRRRAYALVREWPWGTLTG